MLALTAPCYNANRAVNVICDAQDDKLHLLPYILLRSIVEDMCDNLSLQFYPAQFTDNARVYNNEAELGIAIEESGVPRSVLFITRKTLYLDDIEGALRRTLGKIRVPYLDM